MDTGKSGDEILNIMTETTGCEGTWIFESLLKMKLWIKGDTLKWNKMWNKKTQTITEIGHERTSWRKHITKARLAVSMKADALVWVRLYDKAKRLQVVIMDNQNLDVNKAWTENSMIASKFLKK